MPACPYHLAMSPPAPLSPSAPRSPASVIGDRVALEVGIPCGQCGICRKAGYNLCKEDALQE